MTRLLFHFRVKFWMTFVVFKFKGVEMFFSILWVESLINYFYKFVFEIQTSVTVTLTHQRSLELLLPISNTPFFPLLHPLSSQATHSPVSAVQKQFSKTVLSSFYTLIFRHKHSVPQLLLSKFVFKKQFFF